MSHLGRIGNRGGLGEGSGLQGALGCFVLWGNVGVLNYQCFWLWEYYRINKSVAHGLAHVACRWRFDLTSVHSFLYKFNICAYDVYICFGVVYVKLICVVCDVI
jgi:hypothetical protein